MKLRFILLTIAAIWAKQSTADDWNPKYHLAPLQGWMNDPNGLIQFDGFFHVFWQYNPKAPEPGLMHWGHAKSANMLKWEHLPIALTPSLPEDIDGIFSGSAVEQNGNITLIYTGVSENYTRQRQMAATSSDGVVFEKLGVIIDRQDEDRSELNFRDPKVWRQNDTWFAVIGSKTSDNLGEALLYQSSDFFNWTFDRPLAGPDDKMGYMWECPDFFTLGNKQVLIINPQGIDQDGYDYQNLYQTGYFVGTWSPGQNFTIEKNFREIDQGHDFYATQSFEAADGRRILIGWLGMWESKFPEKNQGWAGMLTLPRELTLSESGNLEIRPIREIQEARVEVTSSNNLQLSEFKGLFSQIQSNEIIIDFNLQRTSCEAFGVEIRADTNDSTINGDYVAILVNRTSGRMYLERHYPDYGIEATQRSIPVNFEKELLSLDIFVDSSSIEVFVNNGEAVMSSRIYPKDDERVLFTYGHECGELFVSRYAVYDIIP